MQCSVRWRSRLWSLATMLLLGGAIPVAAQQTGTIRGKVVDATTLRPLSGAQISIPGTGRGSLTNNAGEFLIVNVPTGAQTVRVQMLGYGAQQKPVTVADGQAAAVEFQMTQEALALDEVVVTGTAGRARMREVGNSIAQVNVAEIAEPVRNVESLLQGRVAGVNVNMGSSTMGAGAAIRLRGNVSVSQSNQPLIYVDGVRQSADAYPRNVSSGGSTFSGSQSQSSPLDDINPEDIERIEILKGPAASTLYGTEASAGVIQIFTKKGRAGRTSWSYQTDQSFQWIRPYGSDVRPLLKMDPWLKTGYGQDHTLSVRGGSEQAQYFVSGGFLSGEGVLPNDEEDRYSVRGNISFQASEQLNFDFNSFYTNRAFTNAPTGNSGESLFFNVYRAPVNPLGSEKKEDLDRLLEVQIGQTNERMILGGTARWQPSAWMSHRFTAGFDRLDSHQGIFHPFGYVSQPRGDISDVRWTSQALTLDYVANAEIKVRQDFRNTFSVGGQLIQKDEYRLDGFGRGLPGPGVHTLSSAAERFVFEEEEHVNNGGFFVQNLFNLKDRYFLTAGVRVDGNSAFGQDFGLQTYPKASASYVVSDEPFWNDAWGALKLRGAFGYAGRAPGAFDAIRTWSASSFGGRTAFTPRNLGNPNLGPERTRELEVGFDAALLRQRVTVDFSYYNQVTEDALFPVFRAPSEGFLRSQLENVGRLANEGLELAVNARIIERPSFGWEVGGTVSTNRSEVLETGSSTSYILVEGQPAPVVRGAKVLNAKEYADPKYELDAFFGPNQPTHIINLNTSVRLPFDVQLSTRGEYQGGHWLSDFPSRLVSQRGPYGAVGCDDVYKLVPWGEYQGPGDTHPNLGQVRAIDRARCYKRTRSDVWFMPADFFKLREFTAQVPLGSLIPRTENAVFTASVRNIWRWVNDDFVSFDPEIISNREQVTGLVFGISDQLPPPAVATFSLKVNF